MDVERKFMINYIFISKNPDKKYKYSPFTVIPQCSYQKLDEKEKNTILLRDFKTFVSTERDT